MSDWPAWAQIAVWVAGSLVGPYVVVLALSRMPVDGRVAKAGSAALPLGIAALAWWAHLETSGAPGGNAPSFLRCGLILAGFGGAFLIRWITTLEFERNRALAASLGLSHVRSLPNEFYAGEILGMPVGLTYGPGGARRRPRWICEITSPAAADAVFRARRFPADGVARAFGGALDAAALTLPVEDLGRGLARHEPLRGWEAFAVFADGPQSAARLSRIDAAALPGNLLSLDAGGGRLTAAFEALALDRAEFARLAQMTADIARRLT